MEKHETPVYNVYLHDVDSERPKRIAEMVPHWKAAELVHKFQGSGYSGACYEVRADEDQNYFYEED